MLTITNSTIKENGLESKQGRDMDEYLKNKNNINITNTSFTSAGSFTIIKNHVAGKSIQLKTTGSIETGNNFSAKVEAGAGKIEVVSDLTGLTQNNKKE